MSINDEWEEMHLTPAGWASGSYRHTPWPAVDVPLPEVVVMTVRRHVSATYGGPSRVVEERNPLASADKAWRSRFRNLTARTVVTCYRHRFPMRLGIAHGHVTPELYILSVRSAANE